MITEKDLQEAIAECEGQRNPNANTCIKLAAFYTIQQHMFPGSGYSTAPAPEPVLPSTVSVGGDSEFLELIYGMPESQVWGIMDELMSTLEVLNPKLYSSIIRKLKTKAVE